MLTYVKVNNVSSTLVLISHNSPLILFSSSMNTLFCIKCSVYSMPPGQWTCIYGIFYLLQPKSVLDSTHHSKQMSPMKCSLI